MRNKLPILLTLVVHFLVLIIVNKRVNSTAATEKTEDNKKSSKRRPSFLILDEKNTLTPNYSKEFDCLTPPIYFYDVVNRNIRSLEVACKGTFLLINIQGELRVKLADETFNVNDLNVMKYLFFDYSLDTDRYVLKEYSNLAEIQHKPDYLLEVNFEEIPTDYNTHEDGKYLQWVTKAEFLGVNTISNSIVELPDYLSSSQQEDQFEINIPVKEMLFLVFVIKTNLLGSQNTYFAAFPIFFLCNIIYDVRKPVLNIKLHQAGSDYTETYDIKRGTHYYKGLKLKTNQIRGEKILLSESFYELEKLIKFRFEKLKTQLGLDRDAIVNHSSSVK